MLFFGLYFVGEIKMNQNINNPKNQALFPSAARKRTPQEIVDSIVLWIKAGITLTQWLVLAAVTVALAFVAIKGTLYGVRLILRAITGV